MNDKKLRRCCRETEMREVNPAESDERLTQPVCEVRARAARSLLEREDGAQKK